jgi:predicted DCC family thiol-disulfide oxidoreductase YuxK
MISVSTEVNDAASKPKRGWILFDGECPFCRSWVRRLEPVLSPRGFAFVPLQTPWVREHFRLPDEQLLSEMRVLVRSGETYGGANAIVAVAKYVWWAWPLVAVAYVPGMRLMLRAAYHHVAGRRYCFDGACTVSNSIVDHRKQSHPEQNHES